MEVHLAPELEKKLADLATQSGRPADELVQDAAGGYLDDFSTLRSVLDDHYDDLKNGKVIPIDGEAFFEHLRHEVKEGRTLDHADVVASRTRESR